MRHPFPFPFMQHERQRVFFEFFQAASKAGEGVETGEWTVETAFNNKQAPGCKLQNDMHDVTCHVCGLPSPHT